ncbi:MAG: autotransporter outer membrane beta-barrel domain-containing protein [Pseudomonadota bacterium]
MQRFAAVGAALALAFIPLAQVHAGAWTLPKGEGYNKIAFNYFEATDTFGPGAEGFERFSDLTLNYYAEYGLHDKLTLIGQLPVRWSENETVTGSTDNFGIGDVDLGLRYNLVNSDWVVSTQLLYKLPFLYNEDAALPLGNGQSDLEGRIQIGKSLHPFGYFGVEAAYRYRADDPSDEFRYLVEYGFDASDNVYLRAKLDVIEALQSTNVEFVDGGNPNFPNAFDLGRVEASIGYKVNDRHSVEFTYTNSIFGDNILDGDTFQVGYVFAFKPGR